MSRKRDKPYFSRHAHAPTSLFKRRRPLPRQPIDTSAADAEDDAPTYKPSPPPALVVMGLPPNCSVLDLKSRFEIYGSISRIRIDRDEVGLITFRSKDSAEAAIAASLDPSFAITIDSKPLQVLWATDPLALWREGVGSGNNRENQPSASLSSSSKLLRPELPLSKHGRANKLASTIVNPRVSSDSKPEVPFRGRELVAYDDIL